MPNNKIAKELIEISGLPLAAPSANISGSPSPTSAEHVIADLDGKIDAVIMSESCSVGVESTVITLAQKPFRVLRPGAVTPEEIKELLPGTEVDKAILEEIKNDEKVLSPGMKYKHYSPKTEVFLVEGTSEDFCQFVNQKENSLAVCFDDEEDKIIIKKLPYGKSEDDSEKAKQLFDILRKVDEIEIKTVYVHAPQKEGIGLAVYNRLIRAAAFKVIVL